MSTATRTALWVVRLTGITQVVLGIVFWTGRALPLIPLHMAIGLTFVLALWVLAGLALRAGGNRPLALFAGAWGALVLLFGMTQIRLLLGPMHWIVQVAHLLLGIAAMALAGLLARTISPALMGRGSRSEPRRPVRRRDRSFAR
jgi:hypothetical protein